MSATPADGVTPPVASTREFWALMGYAVALGVFGAVAALLFLGIIGRGAQWYSDSDSGWFGGHACDPERDQHAERGVGADREDSGHRHGRAMLSPVRAAAVRRAWRTPPGQG